MSALPLSLWATAMGSPQAMRRLNGVLTLAWIAMVPISWAAGWLDSVVYVSALSLWALVSGHWAAWQAARVEVRQDEDDDVADVVSLLRDIDARLCRIEVVVEGAGTHSDTQLRLHRM